MSSLTDSMQCMVDQINELQEKLERMELEHSPAISTSMVNCCVGSQLAYSHAVLERRIVLGHELILNLLFHGRQTADGFLIFFVVEDVQW